jgi:isocitrate dehydrogenase
MITLKAFFAFKKQVTINSEGTIFKIYETHYTKILKEICKMSKRRGITRVLLIKR